MEYTAMYEISCGVSNGFGAKYPDQVEREQKIQASGDHAALREAMNCATSFADDYLSNPDTGKTTVRLLSLAGPGGSIALDQKKAVVERTMLQHVLALYAGQDSDGAA
jgi:hypothetical protein